MADHPHTHPLLTLSEHAAERWRERVGDGATVDDILDAYATATKIPPQAMHSVGLRIHPRHAAYMGRMDYRVPRDQDVVLVGKHLTHRTVVVTVLCMTPGQRKAMGFA